ncbi:hypothetical protein ACIPT2_12645 [Pectobacterium brasiliense]|uniref:phage tail fiber protein n=1 Tax=Pectobacterium brasiliense TaxID=180957 RepID=UPI00381405BF
MLNLKNSLAASSGGDYLRTEGLGAGSVTVNGDWRSFLNVRHRGGNTNYESNGDFADWGYAIVDNKMTDSNFNSFVLEKCHGGTWLPSVTLKHTGNTTVDANGFLKTASPIVKLFGNGLSELNAESGGVVVSIPVNRTIHI